MAEQNILKVYLSPTSGLLVRYLDMVVKDCYSLTSLLNFSQASRHIEVRVVAPQYMVYFKLHSRFFLSFQCFAIMIFLYTDRY